jgi:hypothetical protein
MLKVLIALLLFESSLYSEKVLIITHSYNRPDFIEIQNKTFKKFLKDDYEFVVFNDAKDIETADKINQTCDRLNLECIRIPQDIHDRPYLYRLDGEWFHHPSVRCSNVVQYSLDVLGFKHPGIVALVDSDLFLIKEMSIKEYLKGYHLAGLPQSRNNQSTVVDYVWIGIVFLDMTALPDKETLNFNCGRVKNIAVDAGGHTYHYLTDHPSILWKKMNVQHISNFLCESCRKLETAPCCTHNLDILRAEKFDETEIKFLHAGITNCEFILDHHFLHYRSGSNWDYKSPGYHKQKTKLVNDFIDEVCNQ